VQFSFENRQDHFTWNTGSITGWPNIGAELDWTDLQIWQIKLDGILQIHDHWIILSRFAYGDIRDGDSRDSDYLRDHRAGEYIRTVAITDEKSVSAISIGGGYKFKMPRFHFISITPMAGYARQELNLLDRGGSVVIPIQAPFEGSGPHTRYDAEWKGPWFGIRPNVNRGKWTAHASFQYHKRER
jgi:hypothetical protein